MGYRVVPKMQLRERLREEFETLRREDLVIIDRGRPTAVLVHIDRWNGLQAKVERLEEAFELSEHGLAVDLPLGHFSGERGPIRR